jgi:hypothetical protein
MAQAEEPAQPDARDTSVGISAAAPTGAVLTGAAAPGIAPTGAVPVGADIDHFRRAWPLILEAVKKRQIGLSAVLSEGRPETVDGDTLVVKFPAGYKFQADMVSRGDNPRVITEALHEITGRDFKVAARVAVQELPEPESREEDARILSKDELLRC